MKLHDNISHALKDRLFWSASADLHNDTLIPTSRGGTCDQFHSILEGVKTYSNFLTVYTEKLVLPAYRERFLREMDREKILACLAEGRYCSVNYGIKTTHGNLRRLLITIFSTDGDPTSGKCMITATSVDTEYNILKELERQENKQHSLDAELAAQKIMLQSLSKVFFSVTLFNVQQNTSQEIISGEGVHPIFQHETRAQENLDVRRELFVSATDKSFMHNFLDLSSLSERMGTKNSIAAEFYGTNGHWMQATFFVVNRDDAGQLLDVLFLTQIIDEEKSALLKHQSSLRSALDNAVRQAETDSMTGLYNCRSGEKYINEYLAGGDNGMFCLFDIDSFKRFNDQYGHIAGDKVIQGVSSCLKKTFRTGDILIRAGGDEFVIFTPGLVDKAVGAKKLQELNQMVAAMTFEEFEEKVTLSIGTIYTVEHQGNRFKNFFQMADALMYEEKENKKQALLG